MAELSPAQQSAVEAGEGPQLILAGAGSGKTRTIVHRIGYLVGTRHIAPHRILAVTFTNKAATELKYRLSNLIGDDSGGVISGTFHAISLRFLRRFAERLGFPKDFQVIDADDQKTLIKRLLRARNIDSENLHPGYLMSWIEHCKHVGLTPDHAPEQLWNNIDLRELYSEYQQALRNLERMDFSDLILNVVLLMQEASDIAVAISSSFDYVLVDEYQDTNPVQHQWLMLLCRGHNNLTVVGDDDQSIYGWRGADVRHILEFEQAWPGSRVHRLEENYRSRGSILSLANAVIRDNVDRHVKELKPTRETGELPHWCVCNDEYDEARQILVYLEKRHRSGVPWSEMAILYRSNRQSLPLEQVLRELSIPYRIIGGVGFFERMEIKDALAYWAILNRCGDHMHLLRICNTPKRGIGAKGQEQLAMQLAASGMRAADWLDAQAEGGSGLAAKVVELANTFRVLRGEIETMADRGMFAVLDAVGYDHVLHAHGELEAESRRENVRTLGQYIELSMAEGLTPVEFMDRATLLQGGEEQGKNSDDGISMMSLHRAKGLEFDTVVVAGVEEGLLPHQRALDEGDIGVAEERRLLYVGITRARNHLLLTSARVRRFFGDMTFPLPSRFLRQIPEEVLARDEGITVPADVTTTAPPGITLGSGVRHPTFGEGVILGLEGAGDAARVTVQFRRVGIKRLMLKYAALEPL